MRKVYFYSFVLISFVPSEAFAASFEGSLESLVSATVSRIMPLCALPFVGKTALGWVRGDQESVRQLPMVALGVVALLGINGVWAFLQSHVR